ncbi:MAG: hypothetical protein EA419_08940 [Wenzhouxiangella sp.]|nr:MAG: hypothetical protein EA419_08940 [Wenzhouxiangella sp.]
MEWIEGRDLDTLVADEHSSIGARLDLFEQIAEGVIHAHQQRVIHGDLKPSNVRVADDGRVCLVDFGVARLIAEDDEAEPQPFKAMTPAFDEEPVVTPMEITSITCDTGSETVRTRIELGEEGHVLMHDAGQVWLIEVNLTRFDIPGGKREHVYPEEEETTVSLARNGDIEGYYQFQLHGELEGMYVVEMDISC